MHVEKLDAWVGVRSRTVIKSHSSLTILFPDGDRREFRVHYGKRRDPAGDVRGSFAVDLLLPHGTTLLTDSGFPEHVPCSKESGHETSWTIFGHLVRDESFSVTRNSKEPFHGA
jgi:hypothetical protein